MRVVLRADVDNVGKKGDIIEVADGFARNYLIPKGRAIAATKGVQSQADAMRRSRDKKDSADREAAENVARMLVPTVIQVQAKAGAEGKLFGSVTSTELAERVLAQTGVELDRRRIHMDDAIRSVGTHEVPVKLHAEVEFRLTVEVTPGA
jgi:large subunit ribosomal protein L9